MSGNGAKVGDLDGRQVGLGLTSAIPGEIVIFFDGWTDLLG